MMNTYLHSSVPMLSKLSSSLSELTKPNLTLHLGSHRLAKSNQRNCRKHGRSTSSSVISNFDNHPIFSIFFAGLLTLSHRVQSTYLLWLLIRFTIFYFLVHLDTVVVAILTCVPLYNLLRFSKAFGTCHVLSLAITVCTQTCPDLQNLFKSCFILLFLFIISITNMVISIIVIVIIIITLYLL